MQGLQRRRSGIYVARVVVPPALRFVFGRRELIASTKTTVRSVAIVVATEQLARWRRQLHDLGRLVATNATMDAAELLKIADGNAALCVATHVPLMMAGAASGLGIDALLRAAADGELRLYWRAAGAAGYLLHRAALAVDDAELGTRVVPGPDQMPNTAVAHRAVSVLKLPDDDARAVAARLLTANEQVGVVAFEAPNQPDWLFIPDEVPHLWRADIEVLAVEVEALRTRAAARIDPAVLKAARAAQRVGCRGQVQHGGKMAGKRFSEAVELYCTSPAGLPASLRSKTEQGQRRRGLLLFAEFMQDPLLGKVDGDMLRAFRDGPLKTVPANSNHLPPSIRKATMPETVEALAAAGLEWPLLSQAMRDERMGWLSRMFAWLHDKKYLTDNLAAGLRGETGMTRAEARAQHREDLGDDDARGPFTLAELVAIFSMPTFRTGNGAHITKGNERWRPFEFWLPLLGLFGGLRIREGCQLWLSDVVHREGVWCLDINEATADKSLKTEVSRRVVPLHPVLIDAGLIKWCDALRAQGFKRVFPELTFSAGDAAYAKEPKRVMSAMLLSLGMPRDGKRVFHCLRHNANDVLARVSDAASLDEHMRRFTRYQLMGHKPGDDINAKHYTSASIAEKVAMIDSMKLDIPAIHPFDLAAGLDAVRAALDNKMGARRGKEDMGPAA